MVKRSNEERPVQEAAAQSIPHAAGPDIGPDIEQVFRAHSRQVLGAAYRVTGSPEDAEDVLQTVFMRLVRRRGAWPLSDNPGSYLHRAAINAGLDILRSRRGSSTTPLDEVEPVLADAAEERPDRAQDSREFRDQVRKGLTRLSPKSAEVFALRYFEGYDNHEIASMLGTSRSTIAVILHRSREKLRQSIGDYLGVGS